MKIILRRNLANKTPLPSATEHVHSVFLILSHLIAIVNVQTKRAGSDLFNDQEVVEVEYELLESALKEQNMTQLIRETVQLDPNFTLVKIEALTPILEIDAIQKNSFMQTYQIDSTFANYAAHNLEYCQQLKQMNVRQIKLQFEKLRDKTICFTDKLEIILAEEPIEENPFQYFAAAIITNLNLRNKLLTEDYEAVEMCIVGNHIEIRVLVANFYSANTDIDMHNNKRLSI